MPAKPNEQNMTIRNSIWRLHICGNKYLGLIPHDLDYFQTHFVGKTMPEDWPPPPIELSGKSKKIPDFMSWMTSAPVISEKAKLALEPILNGYAQFLPFLDIKGKKFYAMNVTHVETHLLDIEKSVILYSTAEPKVALMLKQAYFVEPLPSNLPPIFKITISTDDVLGEIFVTKKFAEIMIERKLTGLALADPQQNGLKLLMDGKSQNVVLGVIE